MKTALRVRSRSKDKGLVWLGMAAAIAVIQLLAPAPSKAQVTGQITGLITDPSGAAVPSANVTVRNEKTGIVTKVTSNSSGVYVAPLLPPGTYTISVEAPGFQTISRSGVQLAVAESALVNFTLVVGFQRNPLL